MSVDFMDKPKRQLTNNISTRTKRSPFAFQDDYIARF